MAKHNKTVTAALTRIQSTGRAMEADKPLIAQGLIEVNTDDIVNNEAAARLTQKGIDGMPKAPVETANPAPASSNFTIIDDVVVPPSKRGAGRVAGPAKYPFADLVTGKTFFVADSETKDGNALKTIGSAVSNATNKYRVDTGKTEQVERTKRDGKKAALDAAGNKIKETATVPVYEYPRKFVARGVKAGQKLGNWTAPADGAIVQRTV